MSPLRNWIIGFLVLFVVLTIISTFIRDFTGYSIIIGIGLIIAGYLGGGVSGEKYSIARGMMITYDVKAVQKERYYSKPLRTSVLLLIVGAIMFGAGILGYFINSTFFSPY